jgi:phosphatidate cytidylyltransferase
MPSNSENGVSAGSPTSRSTHSNLVQRVLSALILLPLLLFTVWLGGGLYVVVALVCGLLALYELFQLFAHTPYRPRAIGYICVALLMVAATWQSQVAEELVNASLAFAVLATLSVEVWRREHSGSLYNWTLTLSGTIYIGWTFAHFILMRQIDAPLQFGPLTFLRLEPGAAWIVTALLVTFASDTCAYFTGRAIGRRRLAPAISPGKTVEGAAGGLLGALITGALLVALLGLPISLGMGALIGALGGIAGQMGDLAESLIKRQTGVKDSGHIIPGHGGILDRTDSLLFTIPVIYYLVRWLTP